MAEIKFPVTLHRGDQEREVHQLASYNQARWDGFLTEEEVVEAEKARKAAEPSPQQKAAETRRKNAEATAGEKPSTESSVGTSAASGGTAAGERTVGSNPS